MAGPGLIAGAELVGGLIKRGQENQDYINGMFDDHAKRRAGDALAAGDLNGAAGVLASRGMLKEAEALKSQATTRDALTAYNTGDYAGARAAAAQGGNAPLMGSIITDQQTEQKHRAEFLGNAADSLLQIKTQNFGDGGAGTMALRQRAFKEHIAPVLQKMGVPADQIAQIGSSDLSDATLNQFKTTLGQMDKMTISTDAETGEVRGINPQTGEVKILHQGQAKPLILGKDQTAFRDGKVIAQGVPDDGLIVIPEGAKAVPKSVLRAAGGGSNPAPASPSTLKPGFDTFYSAFVAPHEGGYTASDGNGQPANFGINQGANPDVNVKDLTADKAKQLLHDRYWVASGADKIEDPALAAIHGDTAINMGVGAAQSLLAQAGGDPQKYLQLREARYRAIAAADPKKAASLPVWLARNQDLAHYVGGDTGATSAPAGRDGDPAGTIYGNPKSQKSFVDLTPQEVQAAGFKPGTRVQRNADTGQLNVTQTPNENDLKVAGYASRTFSANDRLNSLAEQGIFKPTAQIIVTNKGVMQFAQNPKDRHFVQAAREWMAPILRKDTGAAVTPEEFDYYSGIYIPAPQDDPATLWQKAQARAAAMRSLVGEAGPAYKSMFGDPPPIKALTDSRGSPSSKAPAQATRKPLGEFFK